MRVPSTCATTSRADPLVGQPGLGEDLVAAPVRRGTRPGGPARRPRCPRPRSQLLPDPRADAPDPDAVLDRSRRARCSAASAIHARRHGDHPARVDDRRPDPLRGEAARRPGARAAPSARPPRAGRPWCRRLAQHIHAVRRPPLHASKLAADLSPSSSAAPSGRPPPRRPRAAPRAAGWRRAGRRSGCPVRPAGPRGPTSRGGSGRPGRSRRPGRARR